MAADEVEQGVERLARLAVGRLEVRADVLDQVAVGEGIQRDRTGLVEERPLTVAEQRVQHAGLGAGEDVARLVAMELDLRASEGRAWRTAAAAP